MRPPRISSAASALSTSCAKRAVCDRTTSMGDPAILCPTWTQWLNNQKGSEHDRPHQLPAWPCRACGLCPASCVAGWGCGMSNLAYGVSARRLTRGPGDTGRSRMRCPALDVYKAAARRRVVGYGRLRPAGSIPAASIPPLAGFVQVLRMIQSGCMAVGPLPRNFSGLRTGRLLPAGFDSLARA